MIELYGMASPNVLKVVLMLEEVGLPYRFHHVNMIEGHQYGPELLAINPNGKVPAIVDPEGPDGKPFNVFESGAVLMYLADKTGKFWPKEARAHSTVAQWLMFQMANVGPMSGQFVHFTRAAGPGNDYALSRYTTETRRIYGVLERRLGEARFLGGDEYSIADIATWPWGRRHELLNLRMEEHPNLARWVAEIEARPAAKATNAKEEEIRAHDGKAFQAATPDQLDRFFIRGKYARA
jgi:GST-like protein